LDGVRDAAGRRRVTLPRASHPQVSTGVTAIELPVNCHGELPLAGKGVGVGDQVTEGTRTPAGTSTPTPPDAQQEDAPPRCLAHRHLAPDTDPGPCPGCKRARLTAEQAQRQAQLDARQAMRECRYCDADGRRLALLGQRPTATTCDHRPYQPEPEPDGADDFAAIRAHALTVPCTAAGCGDPGQPTPAGQPCRTHGGEPLRAPAHAARIAAARTTRSVPA
jgi:hypothetical protein